MNQTTLIRPAPEALRDEIAKELFIRSMRVSLDDDFDEVYNHAAKAFRQADAFMQARRQHQSKAPRHD